MNYYPDKNNKKYFVLSFVVLFILLLMSILRYYSIHSTFFDLGFYENKIWKVAFNNEFYLLFSGHFSPIIFIHSLIYRIFPFTETLLILQALVVVFGSYPLFLIAKKRLKVINPLLIVICYYAYFSVQFNILFDFHPDHIIIPVLFYAFYYLEEKKLFAFVISCIIGMTIKEPFNLVIMCLGVYSIIKYKNYKSGLLVVLLSFVMFVVETKYIIPYFAAGSGAMNASNITRYGASISEIIVNIIFKPQIWLNNVFSKEIVQYFFIVFAPLLFIPFLAPLELFVAAPMFIILFLLGNERILSIPSQYLASIIPVIFVALVYGLEKLKNIKKIPVILLFSAVIFNIILSPSPISQVFIRGKSANFSYKAYAIGFRESMIKKVIDKYIPDDPKISVVSQNSLNINRFVKRDLYNAFPHDIANCDFIVLDIKRPLYVLDMLNEKEYYRNLNIIKRTRTLIYANDGFYIFGKKK